MSLATPASPARLTSKLSRLAATVRETWSGARLTDRQLMQLRTHLSRHSG